VSSGIALKIGAISIQPSPGGRRSARAVCRSPSIVVGFPAGASQRCIMGSQWVGMEPIWLSETVRAIKNARRINRMPTFGQEAAPTTLAAVSRSGTVVQGKNNSSSAESL